MSRTARPKQKKPLPPASQLLLHEGVSMSVRQHKVFPERTIRLLITLFGSIGTLWCTQGFFDFPLDIRPMVLFIIAATVTLRLIRHAAPKLGIALIWLLTMMIPAVLLRYRDVAALGGNAVYFIVRKAIMSQDFYQHIATHAGEYTRNECMRFLFDVIILVIILLLDYSDMLLTHTRSSKSGFLIRLLVTFPFLECGLYFGLETNSIAVFMLLCFWIGSLSIARNKPSKKLVEVPELPPKSARKKKPNAETGRYYTTYENSTLILLLFAALLTTVALCSTRHFTRSDQLDQKRSEIKEFYRNLSFNDVTGLLSHLPDSFGMNVVSDEVDLLSSEELHFDGTTALHLSVGAAAAPDDYYLRGIVRSEYTGHGWGIPNSVYRKNRSLFERLTLANRMPQTIFHSDHAEELRTENGKYPAVRCNVKAMHKENTNFVPYQSIYDIGTRFRYDIETELDSTEEYGYWMLSNAAPDWQLFSETMAPSPDKLVSEYEDFVEETYLSIPESEAIDRIERSFTAYKPMESATLESKLRSIRNFIWERAEYTMSPGHTPQDKDYVEYFLTESHRGFCAHYASAAVLLCRMSGIPARYCQGYILTTTNFALGKQGEVYEMDIPDYQAHAWAEVYVKGYGWIPYEFTESVEDSWHTMPGDPEETTAAALTTTTTTTVGYGTTTTTSLPFADTATTSGTAAQDGTEDSPAGHALPVRFLRSLLICCAVLLVLFLYYQLHLWCVSRRSKSMRQTNAENAATCSYVFLMHLLRLQGIQQTNCSYEAFAKYAEAQCRLLAAGRITKALTVQQQNTFSRGGVSTEQAAELCSTAEDLAKQLYESSGTLKRLWYRFGLHIVA